MESPTAFLDSLVALASFLMTLVSCNVIACDDVLPWVPVVWL